MKVAVRWDETISCVECGGWSARWVSKLAGHPGVEHNGDLSQYCRDCRKVFDVTLSERTDYEVRMHPEDVVWSERREWNHVGRTDWWENCPPDAKVHVGHEDTSLWLSRIEEEYREALYTVRVVGDMPKRLVRDVGVGWSMTCAYVNGFEFPGRVSLYLPKSRLELVEKVEL